MSDTVDATFYVQVEPDWTHSMLDGLHKVRGARATRITQNKPKAPAAGTVLVKLTLRLPKASFMPLSPEAVVVVPAPHIQTVDVMTVEPG